MSEIEVPMVTIAQDYLNALKDDNKRLKKELDDGYYRFACLAKKATHGRLSKTNYGMHVYYTEIDDVQQRLCEEYLKENSLQKEVE